MMKENTIKIITHYENMPVPKKNHSDDIGLDLTVMDYSPVSKNTFLLDTGISAEPPKGYYIELYARSGIFKSGFIMANNVGIIDPGYRGKLYMPVYYLGEENPEQAIKNLVGKRFCQLILRQIIDFEIEKTSSLSASPRGEKGLGSSGS